MARDTDARDDEDDRPGLEDALVETDLDDDEDDDEDDFDLDDATEEDVDFAICLYREDGEPSGDELPFEVANDLDELIAELQRQPGDAGALGVVSIAGEFFVMVRVRGENNVQVLVNDASAAEEWPLANDVVDYFGEDDIEDEPLGDFDMLQDLGVSELDLEAMASDYDANSDEIVLAIMDKMQMGVYFRKLVG